MFTPRSTPNQIRSMPSLSAAGRQQRHDDEGELEEVEEEGQEEDQDVDDDQEADLAARQRGQQVLDPDVAVDAVEGEREHARADQDEHHEGRQLGGGVQRLLDQVEATAGASTAPGPARRRRPWRRPRSGVAMPRKIVPSTRKISASGGISTKITCSARRDSRRRPRSWLTTAHHEGEQHADRHGAPRRRQSATVKRWRRGSRSRPRARSRPAARACRRCRRPRGWCAPRAAGPAPPSGRTIVTSST